MVPQELPAATTINPDTVLYTVYDPARGERVSVLARDAPPHEVERYAAIMMEVDQRAKHARSPGGQSMKSPLAKRTLPLPAESPGSL